MIMFYPPLPDWPLLRALRWGVLLSCQLKLVLFGYGFYDIDIEHGASALHPKVASTKLELLQLFFRIGNSAQNQTTPLPSLSPGSTSRIGDGIRIARWSWQSAPPSASPVSSGGPQCAAPR